MKKTIIIFLLTIFLLAIPIMADGCIDMDGDGYGVDNHPDCPNEGYDCNDFDPMINPGVEEICDDGIDNNCNGLIDWDDPSCQECEDKDNDGYYVPVKEGADCGIIDCDDNNAYVNPGVEEIPGDGIDNNCDGLIDIIATDICRITDIYWTDCDQEKINSADEGDGVFLVVETQGCSDLSTVNFYIVEESEDLEITSSEAQFMKIEDYEITWSAYWIAAYMENQNDPDNPEPNYYIEVSVDDPEQGIESNSGKMNLLTVYACPQDEPECGVECEFIPPKGYSGGGSGGGFSETYLPISRGDRCMPQWDCSPAVWSECDPITNKMTRNTNLCRFIGIGDEECAERHRSEIPTEKTCSSNIKVVELPAKEITDVCGDGICSAKEAAMGTCPEDCEDLDDKFPWATIILATIIFAIIVGGGLFGYKYWKKSKAIKPKTNPFDNKNDETAVTNYIKSSKEKNIPDDLIKDALKKSGWDEKQVNYAFENVKPKKPVEQK